MDARSAAENRLAELNGRRWRPGALPGWLAPALAVALGGYAAQLRGRTSSVEAVLAASDLVRIDLAGQPAAPSASARALWSRFGL